MTPFLTTRRIATLLLLTSSCAVLMAGCAVDKAATPDAEMSAAIKTRDDAKVIQGDTQTRVNDSNAVLDGK